MANPSTKLYLYAPDGDFLRPYIEREISDVEFVATADQADYTCAVISLDAEAPQECSMVLRCPVIIGTGMTGMGMEIARRISRGMMYHIKDSDAAMTVVHAVDVAKAVRLTLGDEGQYVISDGCQHTIRDVAEALAWRIDHKRIYTLPRRWARWVLGRRMLEYLTSDHTADGSAFAEKYDFQPQDVCNYLRTHVYDHESL
ncbi:MAG: hypothetical protein ACI391_00085 [Muribaculaceae bacterium]